MRGLEGVRVVELGEMVSAAYATKLMADLGADVVKVEEPQGDLARARGPFPAGEPDGERSGLFLALNTNKRGVTLDLRSSQGQEQLRHLVSSADILLHNYPPARMRASGLDYLAFRDLNPRLVMCSITPFGLTGPYSDYNAYELTLAHGGGWAWLSPGTSEDPALPPLKAFGHQCGFQTGLAAATTTLAAYYRTCATGEGEHIDLSTQEYVTSFLEQNIIYYTYLGKISSRLGRRLLYPWGMFECQDGLIFLLVVEQDQWQRLMELMGNPEWASWEIFKDQWTRAQNSDVLKPYLDEWVSQWKVDDLFRAAQEQRICMSPVFTMADLPRQEQLRTRNFFVEVKHPRAGTLTHLGPPYQLHEPWWEIRCPAPLLGEHNADVFGALSETKLSPASPALPHSPSPRLPLEGVRIADFSWVWAGPYCGLQLAHLGAEVIRLESRAHQDAARRLPLAPAGVKPSPNTSGYFNQWGQGKKSVSVNLSKPEGIAIAKEIIATCDVVLENFATGVMDRMGLDYEALKKLKPDIIVAAISGYGHTGPQRNYMGYGPAIAPLTGIGALTGYAGGGPQEVGISYGDPNGGINAAAAICAALVARQRTGHGQYIDVSLWESAAALTAEGWMDYVMNHTEPPRVGNRDPWIAPHNCFRCTGEDQWVTIACGNDAEWLALCQAIGKPELGADPRFRTARDRKANEDTLEQILATWAETQDKWAVTQTLQAAGVAAFPTLNSKELVEDRHLNERGFFVQLEHPEVGARIHAGIPWHLTNAPNGVRAPAPLLGQHTDEILRDLLGYTEQRIAKLKEDQVLY